MMTQQIKNPNQFLPFPVYLALQQCYLAWFYKQCELLWYNSVHPISSHMGIKCVIFFDWTIFLCATVVHYSNHKSQSAIPHIEIIDYYLKVLFGFSILGQTPQTPLISMWMKYSSLLWSSSKFVSRILESLFFFFTWWLLVLNTYIIDKQVGYITHTAHYIYFLLLFSIFS
jgi:hypothetical protein